MKKYQVFVSSTFEDLQPERLKVLNTLLSNDCVPVGMELFNAGSVEQFEYIKRVMRTADYYIVIVAGRYGSLANDGISYTEKEFDYAQEIGLPILAFLHRNPDELPAKYVEKTDIGKKNLERFRAKASKERMAGFWDNGDELAAIVSSSLREEIMNNPRPGLIRPDGTMEKVTFKNSKSANEYEQELRKEYDSKLDSLKSQVDIYQQTVSRYNNVFMQGGIKTLHRSYKNKIARLQKENSALRKAKRKYSEWEIRHLEEIQEDRDYYNLSGNSIDELVRGCVEMGKRHTGALITIERVDPLDAYLVTGIVTDATITSHMIESIFSSYPAILHDGAVIIRDNRIFAATCILPLTSSSIIDKDLGTRHRAAIGITEVSDAIVIVVSEETGVVSLASSGKMERGLSGSQLRDRLVELLTI